MRAGVGRQRDHARRRRLLEEGHLRRVRERLVPHGSRAGALLRFQLAVIANDRPPVALERCLMIGHLHLAGFLRTRHAFKRQRRPGVLANSAHTPVYPLEPLSRHRNVRSPGRLLTRISHTLTGIVATLLLVESLLPQRFSAGGEGLSTKGVASTSKRL